MTRLDEYDHVEWWDICRRLRPDVTEEEFAEMWAEYLEIKRQREMH
jgi:hypothetical protein